MTAGFHHTLQFGAELCPEDRTRFRLWAPNAAAVDVQLETPEGTVLHPMQMQERGWFEATLDCGAGTAYRYRIARDAADGGPLAVPDPASRAQADDVHGPSLVIDPRAYRWQHAGWLGRPWRETVLYELHVGACGGFDGVRQRLPALAALGITAIELMPIADFPGPHNWGYDGVLAFAPDAAYGSPDALKALIDEAHGLGLMVFLDVVYNHFGPDGNYLGVYAAPFFRADAHSPWGQAIDYTQPAVRDFFAANVLYWLMEYRFDGLRLDAVHAIPDRDWLRSLGDQARAAAEPGRHIHLVLENEDNLAHWLDGRPFDAQWNDDGHHALHVLLTGEHEGYYADHAEAPAERLARVLAEGFGYQGEASVHLGGRARGEPSGDLSPSAFVLFLHNHDQIGNRALGERLTTLADPDALRAATALLLLCPQVPMLFMGDEWGATEPFLFFTSYADAQLAEAVREGRRREFARFAAFTDPARRARIPDPNAVTTFEASIPAAAPGANEAALAWHTLTHGLLAARRMHLAPGLDGARSLGAEAVGPASVQARWRLGDGSTWSLWANLSRETATLPSPVVLPLDARVVFSLRSCVDGLARGELPAFGFAAIQQPASNHPARADRQRR